MIYTFEGRVKAVEERFVKRHTGGALDKATFTEVSIGWWVIFYGWPASMCFGTTKPDFEVGDIIDLTATRRIKQ